MVDENLSYSQNKAKVEKNLKMSEEVIVSEPTRDIRTLCLMFLCFTLLINFKHLFFGYDNGNDDEMEGLAIMMK